MTATAAGPAAFTLPQVEWNGEYVLDAFCCAGGAGMGYHLAGYRVVGVDIDPQPDYPFEFYQGDAVAFILRYGRDFKLIHTSPPCQAKCALTSGTNASRGWGKEHVDLVAPTRAALHEVGRPSVIEQPNGKAEIRKDVSLCGEMFGLPVLRHRNFELDGWSMPNPAHVKHRGRVRGWRHGEYFDGPYLAANGKGGGKATVPEMQDAMGITWTGDRVALTEAIPPAFTRFIGAGFTAHTAALAVAG